MRLTGTKEYCVSQGQHWKDIGCVALLLVFPSPLAGREGQRGTTRALAVHLLLGCRGSVDIVSGGSHRFQGTNPLTDLRGVGMLGLHHLLWVSTTHCEKARQILIDVDQSCYGFAATSMNFSLMALNALRSGFLTT